MLHSVVIDSTDGFRIAESSKPDRNIIHDCNLKGILRAHNGFYTHLKNGFMRSCCLYYQY